MHRNVLFALYLFVAIPSVISYLVLAYFESNRRRQSFSIKKTALFVYKGNIVIFKKSFSIFGLSFDKGVIVPRDYIVLMHQLSPYNYSVMAKDANIGEIRHIKLFDFLFEYEYITGVRRNGCYTFLGGINYDK